MDFTPTRELGIKVNKPETWENEYKIAMALLRRVYDCIEMNHLTDFKLFPYYVGKINFKRTLGDHIFNYLSSRDQFFRDITIKRQKRYRNYMKDSLVFDIETNTDPLCSSITVSPAEPITRKLTATWTIDTTPDLDCCMSEESEKELVELTLKGVVDAMLENYNIKVWTDTVFISGDKFGGFEFNYTIADTHLKPEYKATVRYLGGVQCNFKIDSFAYNYLESKLVEVAETILKLKYPEHFQQLGKL